MSKILMEYGSNYFKPLTHHRLKLVFWNNYCFAKEPDHKENENQPRGIQDFAEIIDPLQHHYPPHHKFYICLSTTYWHIVDNRIFRTT